ncbi:MAG: hypothetical protein IJC98_03695 [Clostridia bacterium]|nr:hypothetical protein [Clostridia bacterium]
MHSDAKKRSCLGDAVLDALILFGVFVYWTEMQDSTGVLTAEYIPPIRQSI